MSLLAQQVLSLITRFIGHGRARLSITEASKDNREDNTEEDWHFKFQVRGQVHAVV